MHSVGLQTSEVICVCKISHFFFYIEEGQFSHFFQVCA